MGQELILEEAVTNTFRSCHHARKPPGGLHCNLNAGYGKPGCERDDLTNLGSTLPIVFLNRILSGKAMGRGVMYVVCALLR